MLRYSVNVINNDFIEILLVCAKSEIEQYQIDTPLIDDALNNDIDNEINFYLFDEAMQVLDEVSDNKWKPYMELKPKFQIKISMHRL